VLKEGETVRRLSSTGEPAANYKEVALFSSLGECKPFTWRAMPRPSYV
jgi:hypothetical protein